MSMPQVLIVEDERALSLALAAAVRQAGATSEVAPTAAQARRKLNEASKPFSAMILDIGLPDENGLSFLDSLPDGARPPTLVITAHGGIENTIQARKLGVREFFPKPLEFDEFKSTLTSLIGEVRDAQPAQEPSAAFIGAAPSMRPVFQQIAHACASDATVLITGETGTGKSLVADLVQRNSENSSQPVITFRPSSQNQSAELVAALERALTGILIVDDVGELQADAQAELLQNWERDQETFPRILAATGTNLREAVENSQFRSELFYRLQVLEISLPPLRDRLEDLPALFEFFVAQLQPGRGISADDDVLSRLESYAWPGNLLELRNVASYALTACGAGSRIGLNHLPEHLISADSPKEFDIGKELGDALGTWLDSHQELPTYRELADDVERILIKQLLARHDGKLARVASAMGANRTTLRKKLKG